MARLRPNIVRAVLGPNGIRPGRTPFGPTSAVEILAKKTRIYGIAMQRGEAGGSADGMRLAAAVVPYPTLSARFVHANLDSHGFLLTARGQGNQGALGPRRA